MSLLTYLTLAFKDRIDMVEWIKNQQNLMNLSSPNKPNILLQYRPYDSIDNAQLKKNQHFVLMREEPDE